MKTTITFLFVALLLSGCNSVKRNKKLLVNGSYDRSIDLAVKKIQKDKNSNKNREHVILLEEAFEKAVARDEREISIIKRDERQTAFVTKEPGLDALRKIYYLYDQLESRQSKIRPLLPLYINGTSRKAVFRFKDYSDAFIAAKKQFGNALWIKSVAYLKTNDKMDARRAYDLLDELQDVRGSDSRLANMMEEALFKGTDFIFVTLNNRSGQIIPHRLEQDLLNFNTYGLDQFWTQYHTERAPDIRYDYGIALNFRQIDFSPERISEREERRTKRIKDGWEYKKDREGNIVKDENGDPIKLDVYKTVSATLFITEQFKAAIVGGDVVFRDLMGKRDLNRFPLATEFIFENMFATYSGDERALSEDDLLLTRNRYVGFPSNAQLLMDASDDIKGRLKEILKDNNF